MCKIIRVKLDALFLEKELNNLKKTRNNHYRHIYNCSRKYSQFDSLLTASVKQIIKMENKTKKLVKKADAVKRQFLGVDFEVLSIGQVSMVTKMLYKSTDNVPLHKHPNEQSGYVISGKYRLLFDNIDYILIAGDSYSIPANVEHTLQIIEAGEIIDVFTPIREDYL